MLTKLIEKLNHERKNTIKNGIYHLIQIKFSYQRNLEVSLENIIDFHVAFEKIHPFSDGNGRVGRLVMFKECLKNNIMPFIRW